MNEATKMRFAFSGGDGDQEWLGENFIAERTREDWFSPEIQRGPAYLLKVLTGSHKGQYLAATSRMVASLEEQIAARNFISVVVHNVLNASVGFEPSPENLSAIGMAAIEVVAPVKSAIFKNPW